MDPQLSLLAKLIRRNLEERLKETKVLEGPPKIFSVFFFVFFIIINHHRDYISLLLFIQVYYYRNNELVKYDFQFQSVSIIIRSTVN